jgi:tetratricopeptide (TPR) repeat protein
MSPDPNRAKSILLAALEQPAGTERDAFLVEACAGDASLRREVDDLLVHSSPPGSFLESPEIVQTVHVPLAAEAAGATIDRYKLVEPIGEGGMGEVWLAQQQEPVKRLVALKVIKAGMDSRAVLARFEAERQALAIMDHPNIAKVLDAGATPAGRPYFVMELVKGSPITNYCDDHRLDPKDRLGLFVQVCQAVQHAHQKGVIHRDLKPSNVLVAPFDGRPVVKVIDFGVAKATGVPLTEKTLVTGFGAVVGTPEYMSPEQAELNNQDIDTRSDIYSLGVLLYELLTGSTPLTRKRAKEAALLEILRLVREEEPQRPSTRLSTTEELPSIAARRGLEPKKLSGLIRGDLDWIVMKALDKDRNRRYETANGLALDVQRYLADEPVTAGPPSVGYRVRKFVRRNRRAVLAASVIVFLLVAGIVGSTVGLFRTLAAERRAIAERDQKDEAWRQTRLALNTTTDEVLDDLLGRQPQLTDQHREFLNKLLAFHADFAAAKGDDPEARQSRAEGFYRVARIRFLLGEFPEAVSAHREAASIQKQLVAEFPDHSDYRLDLATTLSHLGNALLATARPDEAEPCLRDALSLWKELAAQRTELKIRQELVQTHISLGLLLRNTSRMKEAENAYREGLAAALKHRAEDPDRPEFGLDVATTYYILGELLNALQRTKEAEDAYLEALAIRKRLIARFPNRPEFQRDTAMNHTGLAVMLAATNRPKEAAEAYREAIKLAKRQVEESPSRPEFAFELAACHQGYGVLLGNMNRTQEAIDECREAATILKGLLDAHPTRNDYRGLLATALQSVGHGLLHMQRRIEAEKIFLEALEIWKDMAIILPKQNENRRELCHAHLTLGDLFRDTDRPKEAVEEYREAVAVGEKLVHDYPEHADIRHDTALCHFRLGCVLKSTRQAKEAEKEYGQSLTHWERLLGKRPKEPTYRQALATVLTNLGELLPPERRAEAIELYRKAIGQRVDYAQAHYDLGNLYFPKQIDDAIAEYTKALRIDSKFAQAHVNLGNCYAVKGDLDAAMTQYRDAIKIDKDLFEAHLNLGVALRHRDEYEESIVQCQQAIRLNADSAKAHDNLGQSFQGMGQFKEAISALRRAVQLEKTDSELKERLSEAERLSKLDERLPAIVADKEKARNAAEFLDIARLCRLPHRELYVASVRFFGDAFAGDPKLAERPEKWDRYNAACSAALAVRGEGKDAGGLNDKDRSRLRRLALDWLRADLTAWESLLAKDPSSARMVADKMQHWLDDTDFTGIRGSAAIAKLPEAERPAWQKLWDDVGQLQKRARDAQSPPKKTESK